jgi:PAS domain S-box-containing protein
MKLATVDRPEVLIVENEQVVAVDLARSLRQLGYEVSGMAATRADALDLIAAKNPDLVLMDIKLEDGQDGISAAEEIRANWQIPVVFVTEHTDSETLGRAKKAAPLGFLTKPFGLNELNATLVVALHQHRIAREWFAEHQWLMTMLASLGEGVIATDLRGRVRYLNPAAEALTGWKQGEATGRQVEEVYSLVTPCGEAVEHCQLRRALAERSPMPRAQFVLATPSGKQIPIEDVAAPIYDDRGELTGAAALFVDISERFGAERERDRLMAELQRSNRELAQFSYAVSHDLQAPLRTIRSFSELLTRRSKGQMAKEDADVLAMISQVSDSMQTLVRSLLEYAQVGHGEIEREPVETNETVRAVELRLAPQIAECNAALVMGELPVIEADRVQMEQVFQNLITNALKYRRPEVAPVVAITGTATNEGWLFAVTDNGQGIPEEHREAVFQPLKRLHGQEVSGTGLGLSICRTIVERHGGRIRVEGNGCEPGTTVTFTVRRP